MNGAFRGRALLLVALLSLAACSAPPPMQGAAIPEPTYDTAPTWYGKPLSWEKLTEIEGWLAGVGPEHWPDSVPGAELDLANGRLQLARREAGASPSPTLGARLDLAEAGFRRVIADVHATDFHRRQAQDALRAIEGMRSQPAFAAAPSSADVPAILPRSRWGARPANPARMTARRGPWKLITVHHSAIAGGDGDFGTTESSGNALRLIQKSHMEERGYGDIGYHFLIDGRGRVFQGRSLAWRGAHAGSSANIGNIGICLLGDFDRTTPDPRALASLERLIQGLSKRHGIPRSAVKGHREFKATDCPGHSLMAWVRRYTARG